MRRLRQCGARQLLTQMLACLNSFHSARWDHSVDYTNKHVVILGNGSTATQIVPEVAKKAKSVTQFVRAQHWIASKPHNPLAIVPGWSWLIRHFSFFRNFQRAVIFLVMESHFMMTLMNPIGAMMRWWFANRWCKPLAKKAPKEYQKHLLPEGKVLVSSKRRIFDDDYVPSLNQPHVQLPLLHMRAGFRQAMGCPFPVHLKPLVDRLNIGH